MIPTTTPISMIFGSAEWFRSTLSSAMENGTKQAYEWVWSGLMSALKPHLFLAILLFFLIVVTATIKAMFGRWGTLGSVIYNSLYFGTLLIVGLIWGPNVFAGNLFDAIRTVILYPFCYLITGFILDWTRAKHRFQR